MPNAPKAKTRISAAASASASRILMYRPHVAWCYLILKRIAWTASALGLGGGAYWAAQGRYDLAMLFAFGFIALAALVYLFNIRVVRPIATLGVQVFSNRLTLLYSKKVAHPLTWLNEDHHSAHLKNIEKALEIPFVRIVSVQFSFVSNLGGWFKLCLDDGRKFKFTVVLERCEMILDAVNHFDSSLIDQSEWARFRRTAILCDHSWARSYQKLKDWRRLSTELLLYPVLMTVFVFWFFKRQDPTYDLVWTHGLYLWAYLWLRMAVAFVCLYLLEEFFQLARMRKVLLRSPFQARRDLEFEILTRRFCQVLIFLISVAVVIFYSRYEPALFFPA